MRVILILYLDYGVDPYPLVVIVGTPSSEAETTGQYRGKHEQY